MNHTPSDLEAPQTTQDIEALEELGKDDLIPIIMDMQSDLMSLEKELKHYIHLYEYAPVGYISLSENGRILNANLRATLLLGVSIKELLNMPISHFVHPEDQNICKLGCETVMSADKGKTCTLRLLRGHQTVFWAQIETRLDNETDTGKPVCRLILTDITQRMKAELINQDLSLETGRFFESALDLLCIANTDGYFLKLNKEWERTLGYNLQDLEHTRFLDLVHPDDFAATIDKIALLDKGQEVLSFTNRYRHKDGSYRWIEWRSLPSGKLIYAAARDITERRLAEDRLRESEDMFKYVFEASNVGKSITLPDGTLNVNRAFAEMLGYSIEELNTLSWQDVTPQDEIPRIEELIRPLVENRQRSLHFTKRYLHKSGSEVWCDVSVSTRYNEDKSLRHFITTIVDITRERLAEQKYQTLFQEMLSGMALHEMIFDDSGIAVDYRFLDVNPAFERMTGLTKERIVGKTIKEIIPETEDIWIKTYGDVVETGEPAYIAEYSQALDKYFEVTAYRHAPGQFVCIFSDISLRKEVERERNKLQDQILHAQKMESVGRLAGGVAHGFNNMMNIIMGHAEMTLERLRPDDPIYTDIMQIRQAAKRSADLTRQLLAFASKQNIAPRNLDLNELVSDLMKTLRRLVGDSIGLYFQPSSESCVVCMDPSQVDQILMNLCVNARDAISSEGSITITTAVKHVSESDAEASIQKEAGDFVLLSVSDNGTGMDAETLAKVFEPFFTTKALGKGIGLGLATIYGIVQQNHGFAEVESSPQAGTTVKVYLPRINAIENARIAPKPSPTKMDYHILLVEDEAAILKMTSRMLEKIGYHVIPASNPSDALALAKDPANKMDLLLTDVMMASFSGIKLAEGIRILRPGLPCLFMSGFSNTIIPSSEEELLSDFIPKPFSAKELSFKLMTLLTKSKAH